MSRNKMQNGMDKSGATCLVTGANGFVGSHLCEYLLKSGCNVYAFVRRTSDIKYLKDQKVEYRYGELRDEDSLRKAIDGIEYIFHVGGITKAKRKRDFFEVNHIGTANLLKAVVKNGRELKKLVYISSQAAVGPADTDMPADENKYPMPVTDYGRSKLEGEKEVSGYFDKIPSVIIRPPGIYGPRDTEILSFFKAASMGIKPYFGGGDALLSLVYISDLVKGIVQGAFNENTVSKTYFITDGNIYKWNEVVNCLAASFGKKGFRITIPVPLFLFLGSVSETVFKLIGKTPMLTREKAYELTRKNWGCSSEKAMGDFGYSPDITFAMGAKITAKWYKDNRWL